jgi:hypothetical protein
MAMTQDSILVGVFREPTQARHAIEELYRAGYRDDEIGYLGSRHFSPHTHQLKQG